MGSINDAWAHEDVQSLEKSLCADDMFGASLAMGRMFRTLSKEDFKEGFRRALEAACHRMLSQDEPSSDDEEAIDLAMMQRLNLFAGQVEDVCLLGARLSIKWGIVDAMKDSAQAQADALVGVLPHLARLEADEDFGGSLNFHVLDSGQKAFLSSLSMANALERQGVGFDALELREFGSKFKDWIHPKDASLTERGDDLWLGCGGYFESIYLDDDYNPEAPVGFMMRMADAMAQGSNKPPSKAASAEKTSKESPSARKASTWKKVP